MAQREMLIIRKVASASEAGIRCKGPINLSFTAAAANAAMQGSL
jgi:hypothetical protein